MTQLRLPARVDRRHPPRVRPARRRRPRHPAPRGARRRRQPPARSAPTTTLTKRRTIFDDPLVQGLNDTDSEWFRARSLITYVEQINVPIHITGAYQDEQTGPRGPTHLWEQVARRAEAARAHERRPQHREHEHRHGGGLGRPQGVGRPLHGRDGVVPVRHRHPGQDVGDDAPRDPPRRRRQARVQRPHRRRRRSRSSSRRAPTTTCGPAAASPTAKPGATEAPSDSYVSATRRQAWSYQAGPSVRPAVHDGRRSRRAALPRPRR